ncbi:HPr family phosphocarrier protein [Neobacillus kokaensis]|uniref:HPr domain-containing protein n=1 Tax=Neobacillus kokaensis TaxID=2759023 RepID=A0ABQ3N5C3_9BACI|nr:HPr family phosphocarrier protein [Neobacillus kokaensis]GHH99193.1 hypothetical protein AM1BK_27360 [Neobacillus kokaensis]
MIKQSVRINKKAGLYAKPVNQLVQTASEFNADIYLIYNDRRVNVKSVLGILSLAIPNQSEVTIEASGEDEKEALKNIIHFLES